MMKFIRLGGIVTIWLVISSCFLTTMIGDRQRYRFQGTVSSAIDHKRISSVKVAASCEKTRLDPPLETLSDAGGAFVLNGYFYGMLNDCDLSFDHPLYKRKVVRVELKEPGLMQIWTQDIELEPK